MKMVVQFDVDADIIEVPQMVIDRKDGLRTRFLKWLYDKNNRHKYWEKSKKSDGTSFWFVRYRSDAFVEWLNKKPLRNSEEKAHVVAQHVWDYPEDLPLIFF